MRSGVLFQKKNTISLTKNISKKRTINFTNNNLKKDIFKDYIKKSEKELKIINNEIEEDEYNSLPYNQAIRLDKRNIFCIFISIFKMKIGIISILFFPEQFTHYSLNLSKYSFNFLFNYFTNALLYSDDIVSQKYHNNGKLELITSLILSMISNIIASIISWILDKLTFYNQYLDYLVKDVQIKQLFVNIFKKLYERVKIQILIFFTIIIILSSLMTYYLFIFCYIYQKSQVSLLTNNIIGIIQSFLISFVISILICILRYFGLKFHLKYFYRTSVYLNEKI